MKKEKMKLRNVNQRGLLILLIALLSASACKKEKTETDSSGIEIKLKSGTRLKANKLGRGNKHVVFMSGLDSPKEYWGLIQVSLLSDYTTFSYDRAGYAQSDKVSTERDAVSICKELHEALAKAGIKSPYVLVGHSFGGNFAQVYAGLYPSEIKGLIILDAPHQERLKAALPVIDLIKQDQQYEGSKQELDASSKTIQQMDQYKGAEKVPVTLISNMLPEDGESPELKQEDYLLREQWIKSNPNAKHLQSFKGHLIPVNDVEIVVTSIKSYF
jgi:pimeloyl-ACP methyl ester carboxylesterase